MLQADKQKAYEQKILEDKEEQKKNALTALSDYWNEASAGQEQSPPDGTEDPKNPALNTYRSAQSTLGSFYQEDDSETKELRRQLEEMKKELSQKEIPRLPPLMISSPLWKNHIRWRPNTFLQAPILSLLQARTLQWK